MVLLVVFLSLLISLFIYLKGLQKQWEALSFGTPLVILFLALGVFLAYSRETLRTQMKNAEIADQQKQSELELLRSQLSPHFLFNTLNNLYGLSITQHEKIPYLIVKLSELLRYSVYEAKKTFVPLADEIAYIRNYIDMEKIRMGDRLILTVNIEEVSEKKPNIAPMLLIVFIENAFKHSKNSYNLAVKINIDLKVIDDTIFFVINNTCGEKPVINKYQEKNSGMGLANTVRRLQLLYPGESILEQRREKDIYHLSLQLKVK
jgi:LytS/YehU family sensor histidine kinase